MGGSHHSRNYGVLELLATFSKIYPRMYKTYILRRAYMERSNRPTLGQLPQQQHCIPAVVMFHSHCSVRGTVHFTE